MAELEALYAALPVLACRGLCGSSCARHVDASHTERARIAVAGVDLDAPTADGACPALSRAIVASGRCTVHRLRPMVCRLWGAVASMPCPHGCVPEGGLLDDGAAMSLLAASLEAGGHRDTGLGELLEVCAGDPGASAMLSARMRGDRAVEPALAARRATYDLRRRDGGWTAQEREYDDVGDGAAVLLHDVGRGVVLLTRQFRLAAHAGGHVDGLLIEVPAGALDGEPPAAAARREVAEEVGVDLAELVHVLTAHTSAGSITQRTHCCAGAYTPATRTSPGGGLAQEGEDVEVLEVAFTDALAMIREGRITDAKTIMLLQWAALEGPFAGHPRR